MFEKFRNDRFSNYGLCPSHYLSAPGLSWDAILKITKIELEVIPDPDTYTFFEKDARGRISYISNRYKNTNNRYITSYDDPTQESKHNMYLYLNGLYGYAMSKFLPTSGFKWIGTKEIDLNKYTSDSSKECILEGDLEYPKELRELYNDYPLATDKWKSKEKGHLKSN